MRIDPRPAPATKPARRRLSSSAMPAYHLRLLGGTWADLVDAGRFSRRSTGAGVSIRPTAPWRRPSAYADLASRRSPAARWRRRPAPAGGSAAAHENSRSLDRPGRRLDGEVRTGCTICTLATKQKMTKENRRLSLRSNRLFLLRFLVGADGVEPPTFAL